MKPSRLEVHQIHARSADQVRTHAFMCMLARHVEWRMHRRQTPLPFGDDDRPAVRAKRCSAVEIAEVSDRAKAN